MNAEEVDCKRGTITRKRSKTARHENVPTVAYYLWRETFRLLKQERARGSGRALLNQGGGHLKVERLDENGKYYKVDNIATAYNRLKCAQKIDKPLKFLRRTSATLLKSASEWRGLETLYLGHSPRSIEERHYTQAPQELLSDAIKWLGKQYGIT